MKGDAHSAFRVWRSGFGVRRRWGKGRGKVNGRYGERAIVVAVGFEDGDDDEDEDEDDGAPVGWRSLITFGYSGDGQVPHRKGVERRFLLTGSRLW